MPDPRSQSLPEEARPTEEIDEREPQRKPVQMSLRARYRAVDVHGVPEHSQSPTGEGEVDRQPNMAHFDMYPLAPTFGPSDIAVPVEGGELTLEFRRTTGIRSRTISTNPQKRPVTWASDHILGLGWDTNLGSRAVETVPASATEPATIQVVDEIGNSFQYQDRGGELWADTFHSFANDAVRTRLVRAAVPGPGGAATPALLLTRVFGTRLTYVQAASKQTPDRTIHNYYRLTEIRDRNGNTLVYEFDDTTTDRDQQLLVRGIHEKDHPERRIAFEYKDHGDDPDTGDMGFRLVKATDPLGRARTYEYSSALGAPVRGHFMLAAVRHPAVEDASGQPGVLVQPTASFDYYQEDIGTHDREVVNRYAAPSRIVDPRGHATTITYVQEDFPIAIERNGTAGVIYQRTPRVESVTTVDGTARFATHERTPFRVWTSVVDTRGVRVDFDFTSVEVLANNELGAAIYVTKLVRTTAGIGSATFEWAPDPNDNLVRVTDLSSNVIEFRYGGTGPGDPYDAPVRPNHRPDPIENPNHYQAFNRPSERIVDPSGLALTTRYRYETSFNKQVEETDAEGRVTRYQLDANGNRTHVFEPMGKTTVFAYEPDGFVRETVDPDGRITRRERVFDPGDLLAHLTLRSTVAGYATGPALDITTTSIADGMGKVRRVIDPEGHETRFEYDALDRRIRETLPPVENPANPTGALVPSTSETHYDLNGNPVRNVDHNGNATVREFDLFNRLKSERRRMADPASDDPSDLVVRFTYDEVGLKKTATDANGNVTDYHYDALLRTIREVSPRVTFPGGQVVRYETRFEYGRNAGSGAFSYETGWNPTRTTNRRGFATDKSYDAAYRLVREVRRLDEGAGIDPGDPPRAGEPTVEYEHDRGHHEIRRSVWNETARGAPHHQHTYTYRDELYRPTVVVLDMDGDGPGIPLGSPVNDPAAFVGDADDIVMRTTYDLSGNVTGTTDPEGRTTEHEYDGAGRRTLTRQAEVEVHDPAGYNSSSRLRPTTRTEYDKNGNKVLLEDPNHVLTKMEYDARNRLRTTIVDLDGDGRFERTFNGPDIVTEVHYDLGGRVVRAVDSRGNETENQYDRNDRIVGVRYAAVSDAEAGGQLVRPRVEKVYDKNGNVLRVIDPRGVITENSYDELNRQRKVTVAAGSASATTAESEYDANGNVIARVLWNGSRPQTTTYEFDPYDRRTREVLPSVGDGFVRATATTYDRAGNVLTVTDPRAQVVAHSYDRANRLTKSVYRRKQRLVETRSFVYTKTGKTSVVHDGAGVSKLRYDALDRPVAERRRNAGQQSTRRRGERSRGSTTGRAG